MKLLLNKLSLDLFVWTDLVLNFALLLTIDVTLDEILDLSFCKM